MVVADDKQSLTITGNGDVLEPHDGIIGMSTALLTLLLQQPHLRGLDEFLTGAVMLQLLVREAHMHWQLQEH